MKVIAAVGAVTVAGLALAAGTLRSPSSANAGSVVVASPSAPAASAPMSMAAAQSPPATLAVTLERMPRDADSSNQAAWWVPLAISAGASYFAFDSPGATLTTHEGKVGKRTAAGVWSFGSLKKADGTVWVHDDDIGHDQPTIAIDGDGYIHVWTDMHNDNWRYFRSSAPHDVSDLRQRTDMPGSGLFTYPVAKTDASGNVWLIIRNRQSNEGRGELYRWTDATNIWAKISTFAYNADAVVYPDDIAFGTDGSVNIVWEWAKTSPRSLRHYGSFLRYNPGTGAWTYIDGTAATLPVSLTSSASLFFLPLQPGEAFTTSETAQGLQSVKVAINPADNRPTIAYRYRPTNGSGDQNFDVWRVRWNGSTWIDREKVYTATNDVPAGLGLTRTTAQVNIYFANAGGAQRAVKTGAMPWTITGLTPGKAVKRVNVAPLNATTDIVYAAAPTDVDANTGSVYWVEATN